MTQTIAQGFNRAIFIETALTEAKKQLTWYPDSEATKYTKAFIPWFGHSRFYWCGAFVHWCCLQAGLHLEPAPVPRVPGFEQYSWALVETWQRWAQLNQCYYDNDGIFVPEPGDIVIFDWTQTDIHAPDNRWQDHIGIHYQMLGKNYQCLEGNISNKTNIVTRYPQNIKGWVRIKEGLLSA